MDAGPMIDLCYRLQNPELFKPDVPWIPMPDMSAVTAPSENRPEDSPYISAYCEACGCSHTEPLEPDPATP